MNILILGLFLAFAKAQNLIPTVYSDGFFNGTNLIFEAFVNPDTWVPISEGENWIFQYLLFKPVDTEWEGHEPTAYIYRADMVLTDNYEITSTVENGIGQLSIIGGMTKNDNLESIFVVDILEDDWNKTVDFTINISAHYEQIVQNNSTEGDIPAIYSIGYIVEYGDLTVSIDWSDYNENGGDDGNGEDGNTGNDDSDNNTGNDGITNPKYAQGSFNGSHLIYEAFVNNSTWITVEGDWEFSYLEISPVDTNWIPNLPIGVILKDEEDVSTEFEIESSVNEQNEVLKVENLSNEFNLTGIFINGITEENWNVTTEYTANIIAVYVNRGAFYEVEYGEVTIAIDWSKYQEQPELDPEEPDPETSDPEEDPEETSDPELPSTSIRSAESTPISSTSTISSTDGSSKSISTTSSSSISSTSTFEGVAAMNSIKRPMAVLIMIYMM